MAPSPSLPPRPQRSKEGGWDRGEQGEVGCPSWGGQGNDRELVTRRRRAEQGGVRSRRTKKWQGKEESEGEGMRAREWQGGRVIVGKSRGGGEKCAQGVW